MKEHIKDVLKQTLVFSVGMVLLLSSSLVIASQNSIVDQSNRDMNTRLQGDTMVAADATVSAGDTLV